MGPRFAGPIAIIRNWTYCLFYVMAELWGSVVVSVLFWGFANQVRSPDMGSQVQWGSKCRKEWHALNVAVQLAAHGAGTVPPVCSTSPCPLILPLPHFRPPSDHHRG